MHEPAHNRPLTQGTQQLNLEPTAEELVRKTLEWMKKLAKGEELGKDENEEREEGEEKDEEDDKDEEGREVRMRMVG